MNTYNFMVKVLPSLYKTENTLKRYRVLSKFFDDEFNSVNLLNSGYNIEIAAEDKLLVMGNNLKIFKRDRQDLETYRALVKIANYNCNFIPLKNNILKAIEKITGFCPTVKPLWLANDEFENDIGYSFSYSVDSSYPTEILEKIEELISAGVKIVSEFNFSVQGYTIFPVSVLCDDDIFEVKCEIPD